MSHPISVDFETFYSKEYGIKELGMARYVDHERFDPYLIAVSDGRDSWAGEPKNFNWDSLNGATLLSHNQHFDGLVYESMVKKSLAPRIEIEAWHCTANMSAYLCNRRSLADAAQFLLGANLSKDLRDYAKGKTAADIKADGKWDEMLQYGRSDALHCWQLFDRHGAHWPEHERRLSEMTIRQGVRGIQIDVEKLKSYIVAATGFLRIAEEQLPWIQEGRKPSSTKAIAELCRKEGIPTPPVKRWDGEEAFAEWEAAYGGKHTWIQHVANWRSINKFLDSLLTIALRLDPDGILGFSLKYFGAHTGRWSGDSGLNMQNLRKVPLFFDDRGWLISDSIRLDEIEDSETPPSYVAMALDIRSLLIARPGKKLIISDLSQIEPRGLAWLVGNTEALDLMAKGQSPYEAHARQTMGFEGVDMKKADKSGYALAKARVLGLGYGCGWQKFIAAAQTMARLDITKDDPEFTQAENDEGEPCYGSDGQPIMVSGYGFNSRRIVAEFRATNPKITALWKRLDDGFKASVDGDFEMGLPSGRKLIYREVRVERRMVAQKDGTFKVKRVHTAEVSGRRKVIYGGLLCENLVQATARDVFAEHLLVLDEHSKLEVLFSSHDEAIVEADLDVDSKEVEGIMSVCPTWLKGCPIAAEASESPHYKK